MAHMFSFLTLSLLSLLGAAASQQAMTLVKLNLSFSEFSGARCLDGSPAAYYINASNPNNFIVFLEGGGACTSLSGTDDTNCAVRATTKYGSSNSYLPTYVDNTNLLSFLPEVNPDFYTFSKVFVPYCSGDVYAGQRNSTIPGFPYYFSGHLIVQAIIQHLLETTSIGTAQNVLLAGDSAGGIGTIINADFVHAMLPNVANFKAAPQAGWFFPAVVPYAIWAQVGAVTTGPFFGQSNVTVSLWDSYVLPACLAQHSVAYCNSMNFLYPYVTTPLHVAENLQDSYQLFISLGTPVAVTSDPFIAYFSHTMRQDLQQIANKPQNALFAPSCLSHVESLDLTSPVRVQGYSLASSVGSWFFGRGTTPAMLFDTCDGVQCNPSCPPVIPPLALLTAPAAVSSDSNFNLQVFVIVLPVLLGLGVAAAFFVHAALASKGTFDPTEL